MSHIEEIRKLEHIYDAYTLYPLEKHEELAPLNQGHSRMPSKKIIANIDRIVVSRESRSIYQILANEDIEVLYYLLEHERSFVQQYIVNFLKIALRVGNMKMIDLIEQAAPPYENTIYARSLIKYMGELISAYDLTGDEFYINHFKHEFDVLGHLIDKMGMKNVDKHYVITDRASMLNCLRTYMEIFECKSCIYPIEIGLETSTEKDLISNYIYWSEMFDRIVKAGRVSDVEYALEVILRSVGHDAGLQQSFEILNDATPITFEMCERSHEFLNGKSNFYWIISRFGVKLTVEKAHEYFMKLIEKSCWSRALVQDLINNYNIKPTDEQAKKLAEHEQIHEETKSIIAELRKDLRTLRVGRK